MHREVWVRFRPGERVRVRTDRYHSPFRANLARALLPNCSAA
jgi:hypothetical protein